MAAAEGRDGDVAFIAISSADWAAIYDGSGLLGWGDDNWTVIYCVGDNSGEPAGGLPLREEGLSKWLGEMDDHATREQVFVDGFISGAPGSACSRADERTDEQQRA